MDPLSIATGADLDQLVVARRASFLDGDLRGQVSDQVVRGEPLLFLGNDVVESRKQEPYKLSIHGILICGSKTTITITGVHPYVDIAVYDGESDRDASKRALGVANSTGEEDMMVVRVEILTGKDFLYYSHKLRRYARVFFRSLKSRYDFWKTCAARSIKTYSNDKSSYYRVVSRNFGINLSGRNMLIRYERNYATPSKAAYSFLIDIHDIRAAGESDVAACGKYENMILAIFDIEMIPDLPNRFPDAEKNPRDTIFMICICYHFVKRADAILNVCLTLKRSDPVDGVLMIHFATERCLIEAFARSHSFLQPDFITEFNGSGFDWRNVVTKAKLTGALPHFLEDMPITKLQHWELQPSMLSRFHSERRIKTNGATPDAICKGFKAPDFVGFDTMIVFKQLEPNADSHKLNECLRRCNLRSKDDLDVREMFRIYRSGTSAEMSVVGHYCYIDTVVLQQLLLKKNVIQDRREVANLSYTSMYDNFNYAGGSRMRNLLMNRGSKLEYFFDTQYRPENKDPTAKFPGAYVVPPMKGIVKPLLRVDEFLSYSASQLEKAYAVISDRFEEIYHADAPVDLESVPGFLQSYIEYTNSNRNQYPISGLDFASLYSSIIMTYNVSPEKLIIDEEYAQEVMAMGKQLQFVTFPFCGEMLKAWFVRHENVVEDYSVCGKLLIELFERRAGIKRMLKQIGESISEMEKEMKLCPEGYARMAEYKEAQFDYAGYDSMQRAVKIFMNTLYGEMGNFVSCICAVQVAASVTSMGQYNLRLARAFVESELHMKVYYGDSVIGDTPIMIKRVKDGVETKELVSIEELDDRYEMYDNGKECIDYTDENVHVMTEDGYSKIVKVVRHRTNKKLFRVTTHIGSVIVTEDHSLLDSEKKKIKPQDCVVGTELLHWDCPEVETDKPIEDTPNDIAFLKGSFFVDGSCGRFSGEDFALSSKSTPLLAKCVEIFNSYHSDVQLKVIPGVNKAVAVGKAAKLVDEWRNEFYSSRKHKKVPNDILTGSRSTKVAFMQGYYAANGGKISTHLCNKGQIGSQGLYLLLLDLGYDVSLSVRAVSNYRLTFMQSKHRCESPTAIKRIEEIGECAGYVYDLETESHHFAAGVGRVVVHNTDSLYVACNRACFREFDREYFSGRTDKLTYGANLVNETLKQIEEAKRRVNAHLKLDNGSDFLKMAYEEYYGVSHEESVDFYPRKLFLRGLEIVKRGSSDVLKDIVTAVTREVMDIRSTVDIIDAIKRGIERFFTTKWSIEAFAKAKVYRPDKNNISVTTMIRRYREMEYPNVPEPNVHFNTVVCKYYPWTYDVRGRIKSKMSIGDRMELVERVRDEGLEIDLEYYFDNELTGQFARLITFRHEFAEAAPDIADPDQYQRVEDALFKAAKKFISQLAKHYSKAFTNKSYLYTNTWQEINKFVNQRPDLHPFSIDHRLAMRLLATGLSDDIEAKLLAGVHAFVHLSYRTSLTEQQESLFRSELQPVVQYINDNNLETVLTNNLSQWKEKMILHVREEYAYSYVCRQNFPFETMWDILTPQELECIARDPELFPRFSEEQASTIVSSVAGAISRVLTTQQLMH